MRRWPLLLVVSALLATLPASSSQASPSGDSLEQDEAVALQIVAIEKTQGMLRDKYALRKAEMRKRVRALYKLSRASWPRIWFEPEVRQNTSRWLGAARRIASRDIAELQLLDNEIDIANRDEERLRHLGETVQGKEPVSRMKLRRPVSGAKIAAAFGDYDGPTRRVRLRRRGVLLSVHRGELVSAPADGRVRYLGPISGLGQGMIIEHSLAEGITELSVIGNLASPRVALGAELSTGEAIAKTASDALYLEHRVGSMAESWAVDPAPLLE